MKTVKILFSSLVMIIILLTGCNSNLPENQSSDLYYNMLEYSSVYDRLIEDNLMHKTKGDAQTIFLPEYDENTLDEKVMKYIDIYTTPNNIEDWDEEYVLALVSMDNKLNVEDKDVLTRAFALGYCYKNAFSKDYTKSSPSECEKEFNKAMKRAARNAAVALVFAMIEPTAVGEAAVAVYYYIAIEDAQEDYNDCMASATS